MEPVAASLAADTDLDTAWRLMRRHARPALPVVNQDGKVVGLLGLEDFLHHVEADRGLRLGERVRRLLRPRPGRRSRTPRRVGEIMQTPAHGLRLARRDDGIAVAAEVLGQGSQAALPIVDAQGGLVGMLGAAGLNAVLFHHEALGHIRGDGT
jgi:CBS domain-containing membrane protein